MGYALLLSLYTLGCCQFVGRLLVFWVYFECIFAVSALFFYWLVLLIKFLFLFVKFFRSQYFLAIFGSIVWQFYKTAIVI